MWNSGTLATTHQFVFLETSVTYMVYKPTHHTFILIEEAEQKNKDLWTRPEILEENKT